MSINKWISALAAIAVTSAIAIAAQQTIGVGTVANDGTGDPIRTAFGKANDNFTELYARPQGTVTSIATACGASGGTITTTGTIRASMTPNAQTGTTYTPAAADCGGFITLTNASAIAITLSNSNFSAGDFFEARVLSTSAGAATFTPSSGTVGGSATFVLHAGETSGFIFDGTNWVVTGKYVVAPQTALTANVPIIGNGGGSVAVGARSGNTTTFGTTSGTLTSGNCAKFDASGNIVDNGAACAGGTSWTPFPGYKSSNWYGSYGATGNSATSGTPVASTVYCHPFIVAPSGGTFKTFGMISTTQAVGNVSMALYSADGTGGRPGTLVASIGSTAVSTNTASISSAVSGGGGTVTLSSGAYYACESSDNTSVRYSGPQIGTANAYGALLGASTLTTALSVANLPTGVSCTAASTCGTGFAAYSGSTFTWASFSNPTFSEVTSTVIGSVALQAN